MSDVKKIPVPISMTVADRDRLDAEAERLGKELGRFVSRSQVVAMSVELYFETIMYKSLADWVNAQPVKEQS